MANYLCGALSDVLCDIVNLQIQVLTHMRKFPISVQADLVIACVVLHNFIGRYHGHDMYFNMSHIEMEHDTERGEVEMSDEDPNLHTIVGERIQGEAIRHVIATDMWNARVFPLAKKFQFNGIMPELEEKLDIMFGPVIATGADVWVPNSDILPSELRDAEEFASSKEEHQDDEQDGRDQLMMFVYSNMFLRSPIYNFPASPSEKFYLVDVEYPLQRDFLKPYSEMRHHIPNF